MYLFMFISYFTFHAFSKITGEGVYFSPVLDNSVLSTFKKSITMQLEIVLEHGGRFHELEILQGQVIDVVIKRLVLVIKILSPESVRVRSHVLLDRLHEIDGVQGKRFKLDSHLRFRGKRASDATVTGEVVRGIVVLHVREAVLVNVFPHLFLSPEHDR